MLFQLKLSKVLDSLSSSTSLTITGSDWSVQFDGLNSPFTSHHSCTLSDEGHGSETGIIEVANQKHCLWFSTYFADLPAMKGDFMAGQVWTSRLVDLLHRDGIFCSLPIKLGWELPKLARVAIPDTFRGFDDFGHPLFDPAWEVGFSLNFDLYPQVWRRNSTCLVHQVDWAGREIWVERNQRELWFSLDINPLNNADPSSVIEMRLGAEFSECPALGEIMVPEHPALQTLQRRGFTVETDISHHVRLVRFEGQDDDK